MKQTKMSKVVIIGGGFAGISAAKSFGDKPNVQVTLIDKSNYHLFQPLLYQVAMAGLPLVKLHSLFDPSLHNIKILMSFMGMLHKSILKTKPLQLNIHLTSLII